VAASHVHHHSDSLTLTRTIPTSIIGIRMISWSKIDSSAKPRILVFV